MCRVSVSCCIPKNNISFQTNRTINLLKEFYKFDYNILDFPVNTVQEYIWWQGRKFIFCILLAIVQK